MASVMTTKLLRHPPRRFPTSLLLAPKTQCLSSERASLVVSLFCVSSSQSQAKPGFEPELSQLTSYPAASPMPSLVTSEVEAASASSAGQPLNFGLVLPGLYRSSYPKSENFGFLQGLGLKTVVYGGPVTCLGIGLQMAPGSDELTSCLDHCRRRMSLMRSCCRLSPAAGFATSSSA